MDWYKAAFSISLFSTIPLFAEIPKTTASEIPPIEVTLPTTTNRIPYPTDSKGKPVNFPPLAADTTSPEGSKDVRIVASNSNPVAQPAATSPQTNLDTPTTSAANTAPIAELQKLLLPATAEAAVILSRNQFYPQKLRVPQGTRVRIWFTTVESKPAALIVEGLQMQRWIASENGSLTPSASATPGYFELQRELTRERVTEITLQSSAGTYPFFDALSGARGEIVVE